jgi:uncharacterized repeat protein (TIGR03803 family)
LATCAGYGQKFYGVTGGEGRNNQGAIFFFDPSTRTVAAVNVFPITQSGSNDSLKEKANDEKPYGGNNGGTSEGGVGFSIDPTTAYKRVKNLTLFMALILLVVLRREMIKIIGLTSAEAFTMH